MPLLIACAGRHNNAWRKAEAAGLPHDLTPGYGDPTHCLGCSAHAYRQLVELPELLAAIWLEAVNGTRAGSDTGTIGRVGLDATWPGQSARLLTDLIVGGMTELEDDLRELRHLRPRPDRGREGQTATGAVTFLLTHLEWALAYHPAATEPHDRDSANPAAQIGYWNRAATRFTRRDELIKQQEAPCPRCERRSLFFADGSDYVECQWADCGVLLTEAEYQDWSRIAAVEYGAKERAGAEDRFAVISAAAECAQEASVA